MWDFMVGVIPCRFSSSKTARASAHRVCAWSELTKFVTNHLGFATLDGEGASDGMTGSDQPKIVT